jgi:glycosyltransferase involved in cell wall biosynthesis
MSAPPFVSIIMPVRNEAGFIRRSLGAVLAQDYPADRYEVIVVDGLSTDGTPEIVAGLAPAVLAERPDPTLLERAPAAAGAEPAQPPVVLLRNPSRIVPPAMNLGLRQARGEVVIRVDGHCEIRPDYVSRCVTVLERTGAECVGGPLVTRGQTYVSETIAIAQSSWFGVGGAAFRTGRRAPGPVDTVAFGAYRRSVFERIGEFDEDLVRNQDDEFNFRLLQAGGCIWLDPDIQCVYYSRANLGRLWKQYFQYGFYKVLVFRKRGSIASWRHLVPALFVLALLLSIGLEVTTGHPLWGLPVLGPYVLANVVASVFALWRHWQLLPLLPVVFTVLHFAYGLGFLLGLWQWLFWAPVVRRQPPRRTPALPRLFARHTRPLRVGILTQYYPPEIGAPQVRLPELAKRLKQRGHEVTVLTAMPNYPTGHLYPGYRGLYRREVRDGIPVLRAAIFPTKSVSMVPRMSNYLSFMASSFLIGLFKLPRLDYLVTESPPLFLGITGHLLARLKGSRWLFNVSDLWPDSAVRLGVLRKRLNYRLARRLEAYLYRVSWLVTGQSRETLDSIRGRFPDVNVRHLSNGVDVTSFAPERRSAEARRLLVPGPEPCVVALYAGLHGIAQGLEQILHAAAALRDLECLRFILVGDGPEKEKLIRLAREKQLTNVRFLDPVAPASVPALVASADIGLVPLKVRLPGAIPSKLYETMACGLPSVLVAEGEPAQIVEESGAGLVVRPGDAAGLEQALRRLCADAALRRRLGENGRRIACDRFDRNLILREFVAFLEQETPGLCEPPAPLAAARLQPTPLT